ncbi:MAG: M28 family metallopeptidase [Candidatus Acetothermia bacterium]|nr:M28 family metallopeptidase [Candidatus Acetothermia bacterium]
MMPRFSPQRLISHVEALAGLIGPRGTGRAAEARAASWLCERLRALGLSPAEERFRAVADMNWFPISAAALSLSGVVLYPWAAWLAGLLASLAVAVLWCALTRADSPLRLLLPHVASRNVRAAIPPRGRVERRVVLLSHLDSNRCRFAWRAGKARTARLGSGATLAIYGLNGLLYLLGAASGWKWPYWASLPGAGYALATLLLLIAELGQPYSPGANDNASGVAVNLELAGRLAREPLDRTEVWHLFTGAEEVDHRGLKLFLEREKGLREAWFIDLEGVGSGELCYLVEAGLIRRYRPDPELLAVAEQVAARRAELGVSPARTLVVDEVQTLRRLGYRAITIAGRDERTASLPHWHTAEDVVENVSGEALVQAAEFVWAMLEALDRQEG